MILIVLGIAATGCTSIGFLAGATWAALLRLDADRPPLDRAGHHDRHYRAHIRAVRPSDQDVFTLAS